MRRAVPAGTHGGHWRWAGKARDLDGRNQVDKWAPLNIATVQAHPGPLRLTPARACANRVGTSPDTRSQVVRLIQLRAERAVGKVSLVNASSRLNAAMIETLIAVLATAFVVLVMAGNLLLP